MANYVMRIVPSKISNAKEEIYFFFPCIAGRVRDIVGQPLEFWCEGKLITAEIPW